MIGDGSAVDDRPVILCLLKETNEVKPLEDEHASPSRVVVRKLSD